MLSFTQPFPLLYWDVFVSYGGDAVLRYAICAIRFRDPVRLRQHYILLHSHEFVNKRVKAHRNRKSAF